MTSTRKISLLLVALTVFSWKTFAQDLTQQVVPDRVNSEEQQKKPYVILISVDGLRNDFIEKYQAENLKAFAEKGVSAPYMQPSYPSLTFPNHYSIVTGMYPGHHGLVDNSFYDKSRLQGYGMGNKKAVGDGTWYGGTPLWVLAEQQKMVSASFYWVASESDVQGVRPSYYYLYNEKIGIDERIRTVKEWLRLPESKRPHLITFYFPEVDHEAHYFGPDAEKTGEAVKFVDNSIAKLVATVDSLGLPVNYVLVSDHGMVLSDNKNPMPLPAAVDTSRFTVPYGSTQLHLYAKNKADIKPTYKAILKEASGYRAYLNKKIPKKWHYGGKDDRFGRVGDILLVADYPKTFSLNGRGGSPGKHGYDPAFPEMRASFAAWGPAFREGQVIDAFENVHVFPLITKILGLEYHHKIDGDARLLESVLKK